MTFAFIFGQIQAEELPANHIHDKANVFRDHPERLEDVVSDLENLKIKYGYKIYLATYYSVLSSSLQERSNEIYQKWLGDENKGLVIVMQLDPVVEGQTMAMSYHKNADSEYARGAGIVPANEWRAIFAKMRRNSRNAKDDAERIEKMISVIEREMALSKTAIPLESVESDNPKLKVIFAIVGLLLLLVAVFLWRIFSKRGRSFYFPEVQVDQRLGAPYGGGHASEAKFAPFSLRK